MRTLLAVLRRALVATLAAALLAFLAINLLALPEPSVLPAPVRSPVTVISNANVVDPRGHGSIAYGQMIVIVGDTISYVGADGSRPVPAGAKVVPAGGKYLMPGLWDSHIHTLRLSPQLHFPLLIANGVTSVRDMGNACSWSGSADCEPGTQRWRAQIQAGEITGPRIVESVSYHLEDVPEHDAELRELIATLKGRGERFLKIQMDEQVPADDFAKVMRVAGEEGYRVSGHIPFSVDLLEGTHPLAGIEHDGSLLPQCSDFRARFDGKNRSKAALLAGMNRARCERVLKHLGKHGWTYTPTHIASSGQDAAFASGASSTGAPAQRYVIAPQRWIWSFLRSAGKEGPEERKILAQVHQAALGLTKQAHEAGVTVLAGSDALDADVIHGFSLHQELQNLVAAGLTPSQALFAATVGPARAHGAESRLGLIEAGKYADMVLLDADPLRDIRNTQRISAVVADGRWYGKQERASAMRFVEDQAHRISVICRFLRGLWFEA
ncbi:amidohydrolase family protein [Lysobacter sp. CCNWLW3]|uniref:amidohydrolase family protein n=1 Tax=unclassified Lysobacter TaxID=2635362 RepID=UPI002FD22D31